MITRGNVTDSSTGLPGGMTGGSEELLQVVSFTIGGEEFGVDILKVQEINRMSAVTRIPNSPEYLEGVINLRGRVIPVMDLRSRMGMERKERDNNTRIVVVEVDGRMAGFIVDAVQEVLRIPKRLTEPPPAMTRRLSDDLIKGVGRLGDRLLILLDLNKVVFPETMETASEGIGNAGEPLLSRPLDQWKGVTAY